VTESEWLATEDVAAMLRYVEAGAFDQRWRDHPGTKAIDRKLRLFACACCLANGTAVEVVDVYEKNGPPNQDGRDDHTDAEWAHIWASTSTRVTQAQKAALLREVVGNPFSPPRVWRTENGLHPVHNGSIMLQVNCLTPQAVSLAQAAYDHRTADGRLDPLTLAAVADALEEAGCDTQRKEQCPRCDGMRGYNEMGPNTFWQTCRRCEGVGYLVTPYPLLAHLRSPGPHVRGCWALDLLLGRN
jgi:hypothetical protein